MTSATKSRAAKAQADRPRRQPTAEEKQRQREHVEGNCTHCERIVLLLDALEDAYEAISEAHDNRRKCPRDENDEGLPCPCEDVEAAWWLISNLRSAAMDRLGLFGRDAYNCRLYGERPMYLVPLDRDVVKLAIEAGGDWPGTYISNLIRPLLTVGRKGEA